MSAQLFKYELSEKGVGTITLSRPEVHNAFNDELILSLTEHFKTLERQADLKLVVITGEGKSFCAGADLNWMKKMADYTQAENIEDSRRLAELFAVINNFSRPVIGKVSGAALGGGAGLVAVCDYVLAVDTASFGFTEVRLGLIPAVISPYVLAKIGESQARAYFLTGERFNAFRAQQMGLIHQVCSSEDLKDCFKQVEKKFLSAAPKAAMAAKKLIGRVLSFEAQEDKQKQQYTCEAIANQRVSPEGQEGMAALLEKRKPLWPL